MIQRCPCIDKGGSPLDSTLHSFRALFINISGQFCGLRTSCFSPEHLVSWDCSLGFSSEHLVSIRMGTAILLSYS
ncbi:hypothetical protein RchiOBHm_Chr5g0066011 [Rosa chinensis]|uniref:Uncharacterized protein n=1 Tax=Rosa chinensis TaxID=74649 RepID=A0A2P6QJ29_ROSCH|nr:hypothetical protein RchiOBHm_Chr5g0066011 [Rosa chinensis]